MVFNIHIPRSVGRFARAGASASDALFIESISC
jgi:hypothetical protein